MRSRRDFLPFGEELSVNVGGRSAALNYGSQTDEVRQKFTGYQKDSETSLDFAEARMYENRFGRFTAVDPLLASGKSANPQTFNRFIYVGNNPINITDPLGLDWYRRKSSTEGREWDYQWFDGKADDGWSAVDFGPVDNNYYALDDAYLGKNPLERIYLNRYGPSYYTQAEFSAMMERRSYGFGDALADTGIGAAKEAWNGYAAFNNGFYWALSRPSPFAYSGQTTPAPFQISYWEPENQVQANAGIALTLVSFYLGSIRY